MGVKVPGTKYSFWCERDIRGTNGTKREKYGEKYSGVNAAIGETHATKVIQFNYRAFSFCFSLRSASNLKKAWTWMQPNTKGSSSKGAYSTSRSNQHSARVSNHSFSCWGQIRFSCRISFFKLSQNTQTHSCSQTNTHNPSPETRGSFSTSRALNSHIRSRTHTRTHTQPHTQYAQYTPPLIS